MELHTYSFSFACQHFFVEMTLMMNWMIPTLPTLSMCIMAVARNITGIKVVRGSMVIDTSGGISEYCLDPD